jgi:ElaA protein
VADVTSKRFDELTARELHDILRLRCDVFVVEQACAYADVDGRDTEPGTRHIWVADGPDEPILAYLRTLTEPDGTVRIGRVVTAPAARGRGLAARLVEHVGTTVPAPLTLEAQSHLAAWYVGLGYEATGPEYVEDGIPHVPMRRMPAT